MSTTPQTYAATLYPTQAGQLTVGQLFTAAQPTCPVALCFSGGGSRAMTSALGQLQALELLQANGRSLLSQARIISTVSGGSWIGVPFVYLSQGSDADFLGAYTPPQQLSDSTLGNLPPQGIGIQITSEFSPAAMAIKALILYFDGVPADMLWQTIVGLHVLAPFDLYTPQDGSTYTPDTFFSLNSARVQSILGQTYPDVSTDNPALPSDASVVSTLQNQQRPFLVCNTAVRVVDNTDGLNAFAPVQVTPVMTGVVSQPPAKDINGLAPGGGGVESFAFDSSPQASASGAVAAAQPRQWSLVDSVGSSSAFFAATIEEYFAKWKSNPVLLAADIAAHGPAAIQFLRSRGGLAANGEQTLSKLAASSAQNDMASVAAQLSGIADLAPQYTYWPVATVPAGQTLKPGFFADGGSLENAGVASALAYSDITTVIAFLNSETVLEKGVVDSMVPPLFGAQGSGANPDFRNNCVFQRYSASGIDNYQELLDGLWAASGSGTYAGTAVFQQTLTTVDNPWFGVTAGRTITVLWVYMEYSTAWHDAIEDTVVRLRVDLLKLLEQFPHFNTFNTELSGEDINLLSSLTAWTVQTNAALFQSLFPKAC